MRDEDQELPGRSQVLGRALLYLLGAVLAADQDLLTRDLDLDGVLLHLPSTHRTLCRLHELLLRSEPYTGRGDDRGDSQEWILARHSGSDFQILAHFANRSSDRAAARIGGRAAKFTAEGIGEVAVAGKPEFQCQRCEV